MKLSPTDFAKLVHEALDDIPAPLRGYLRDVVVEIEPMPDPAVCREFGSDDPRGLLGLYHGTPLTDRSVEQTGHLPDRIVLYQRNLERACRTFRRLKQEIRKTVFHEVGHHFGLDEQELAELGY